MRRPGFDTRAISRITGSPSTYFSSIFSSETPGRTESLLNPRMYPSRRRTSSTLARSFDAGAATTAWRARCPLRMRVSISPSGSLIDIDNASLPARLDHAGDQPGRGELAQRDARQLELAVIPARTPAQFAAVVQPRVRAVAGQLGELELRLEAVFRRRVAVAGERLEPGAARVDALDQLRASRVFFDRALFCHGIEFSAGNQFVNGMSKPFRRALASASVLAVVTMTMSIPRTVSTLS